MFETPAISRRQIAPSLHLRFWSCNFKLGFHIIAPVATVVAVVEKRVLTQRYFLSDASDTVFPYDRRCRSISLKLSRGDLDSITNFCARIWRYFQNTGRCERRNRRKRLEFLQIPPVTSPDIFTFFLRIYIRGTHFKRFADLRQQFILIHLSL